MLAGFIQGEWVQVYNPCRVKTIRIAAYSVIYNSGSGPTNVVRYTYILFYLPLVHFPARIAAEVRGEGVPAPNLGSLVVAEVRESGVQNVGTARIGRRLDDLFINACI